METTITIDTDELAQVLVTDHSFVTEDTVLETVEGVLPDMDDYAGVAAVEELDSRVLDLEQNVLDADDYATHDSVTEAVELHVDELLRGFDPERPCSLGQTFKDAVIRILDIELAQRDPEPADDTIVAPDTGTDPAPADDEPVTDPEPAAMSWSYANRLLEALPAYTTVIVHWRPSYDAEARQYRLMARDLPGPGRRFTNLDQGMEWFVPADGNGWHGIVRIEFPAITVETQ